MAPATEFQGSFLSRISIRRNQFVSMDVNHEQELEELDYFQKHVAERFSELLTSPSPPSSFSDAAAVSQPSDPILSILWLVAAVPCQTSSVLVAPLSLPRHQSWASAAVSIQERIGEEMKRKEKRCGGGGGLMQEMQRMERIGLSLMEFAEKFRFPAEEE